MVVYSSVLSLTVLAVTLFSGKSYAYNSEGGSGSITKNDITFILRTTDAALGSVRNPLTTAGGENKNRTRSYLRNQLSQIASQVGTRAIFNQRSYNTTIYGSNNQEIAVDGLNFIVAYKGTKPVSEDQPLMIIAHYDTDNNEHNPIDDNGSGVIALIILAHVLAMDIAQDRVVLENSVIFVASDTALGKYENGVPPTSTVGAGEIARNWLPEFMVGRNAFRGAIVLDNIMLYNSSARSQNANEFSKSFPSAHNEMSNSNFAGDFLALVHRDDDLDRPLVAAFERGWTQAMKQKRNSDSQSFADPKLIKFPFMLPYPVSDPALHFLRSDQTEFWNHHTRVESKLYPAILLTDTAKYRTSPCTYVTCTIERMETPENVDFLKRVTQSVYETMIDLQTTQRSSSSMPSFSFLTVLAGISLRYLYAMNL